MGQQQSSGQARGNGVRAQGGGRPKSLFGSSGGAHQVLFSSPVGSKKLERKLLALARRHEGSRGRDADGHGYGRSPASSMRSPVSSRSPASSHSPTSSLRSPPYTAQHSPTSISQSHAYSQSQSLASSRSPRSPQSARSDGNAAGSPSASGSHGSRSGSGGRRGGARGDGRDTSPLSSTRGSLREGEGGVGSGLYSQRGERWDQQRVGNEEDMDIAGSAALGGLSGASGGANGAIRAGPGSSGAAAEGQEQRSTRSFFMYVLVKGAGLVTKRVHPSARSFTGRRVAGCSVVFGVEHLPLT